MSTSEPARPYHHGDLAATLVQGGLALLREGGAEALGLRAAARRAGVSAAAPYRHFADKEALLAAIAAYGFQALGDRLAAADAASSDPHGALVAQGVAYVRFACDEPALFRLMFRAAPAGHAALDAAGDRAFAMLAGRVASVAAEPLRADLTLAAWSIVHGLASLIVDGRLPGQLAADPGALAGRITVLLLHSALTERAMRPK